MNNVTPGFESCGSVMYTNGEASLRSENELIISSSISTLGSEKVIQHGHLLRKGASPSNGAYDEISTLGEKNIASNFTSIFNNLDHSSTYYISAYIELESGLCIHTNPSIINTVVKDFVSLRTLSFNPKDNGVVDVVGIIDNTHNKVVNRYGFIYKAGDGRPDEFNATKVSGTDLSGVVSHSYSESIDDLLTDKIYSISAFAENEAGIVIADPIKIHHFDFDFEKFDITNAAFEPVLFESFDNEENGWFEGTGTNTGARYSISGGEYTINTESQATSIYFNNPKEILKGLDNYQIDLTTRVRSGGDKSSGIRFERSESGSGYYFGINDDNNNLYYYIGYWDNLDLSKEIKSVNTTFIDGYRNLLSVRKVDGIFRLYINGNLIHTFSDDLFDGHEVGLRAAENTTIDYEELVIYKLPG